MSHRTLEVLKVRARSRLQPLRVREYRSAGSFRRESLLGRFRLRHTSVWSYSTVQDLLIPQGTKGCFVQGCLTRYRTLRAQRFPLRRPERPEGCDPTRREGRVVVSDQSRWRVRGTLRDTAQRVRSIHAAPGHLGPLPPPQNAHKRRPERGISLLQASHKRVW